MPLAVLVYLLPEDLFYNKAEIVRSLKWCTTGASDGADDSAHSGVRSFVSDSELVLFVSAEGSWRCRQGFFSSTGWQFFLLPVEHFTVTLSVQNCSPRNIYLSNIAELLTVKWTLHCIKYILLKHLLSHHLFLLLHSPLNPPIKIPTSPKYNFHIIT